MQHGGLSSRLLVQHQLYLLSIIFYLLPFIFYPLSFIFHLLSFLFILVFFVCFFCFYITCLIKEDVGMVCGECEDSYFGPQCLACPQCGLNGTCVCQGKRGTDRRRREREREKGREDGERLLTICSSFLSSPYPPFLELYNHWRWAVCLPTRLLWYVTTPRLFLFLFLILIFIFLFILLLTGGSCRACPQCVHGKCSDGRRGDGKCTCSLVWGGILFHLLFVFFLSLFALFVLFCLLSSYVFVISGELCDSRWKMYAMGGLPAVVIVVVVVVVLVRIQRSKREYKVIEKHSQKNK